jgi:23S rRNA pseudouridine955/2504/2580 synthase
MRAGMVRKQYLALVRGSWQLGGIDIDTPLTVHREGSGARVRVDADGKPSLSRFRLVRHYGAAASLLEVEIPTGRTHQIRVHAASVGHPVAGDERYGDEGFNAACAALGLKRMFLHAQLIEFVWPASGVEFCVSAPLPEALRDFLDALPDS